MSNLIPFRIRDFLRPFPPFDRMEEAALLTLSHQARVLFFNRQERIVPEQGELQGLCLLLHEGAVSVLVAGNEDPGLTDKLQAGDWISCRVLGVAPSAKLDYIAAEDCLLYGFSSDLLTQMLPQPKTQENNVNPDFFALQRVTPQQQLIPRSAGRDRYRQRSAQQSGYRRNSYPCSRSPNYEQPRGVCASE
jgi:signal-transduction protein with cAMP-binding, CBS, and nucleotidyltransferase domain